MCGASLRWTRIPARAFNVNHLVPHVFKTLNMSPQQAAHEDDIVQLSSRASQGQPNIGAEMNESMQPRHMGRLPRLSIPSPDRSNRSKLSPRAAWKTHRDSVMRSPRGAKTSRPDLESAASWRKALGFQSLSSNNPVLNWREPASQAALHRLPKRGFSRFLADGVKNVTGKSMFSKF